MSENNKSIKMEQFRKFMISKGYTYLAVYYDGDGDDGECYDMEGYKTERIPDDHTADIISRHKYVDGKFVDLTYEEAIKHGKYNQYNVFKLLKEFKQKYNIDIDAYDIADYVAHDWCNNDGGQGRVVFDLRKATVIVFGEQNYTAQTYVLEKHHLSGKSEYIRNDEGMPSPN